jgi:hypothetical protein
MAAFAATALELYLWLKLGSAPKAFFGLVAPAVRAAVLVAINTVNHYGVAAVALCSTSIHFYPPLGKYHCLYWNTPYGQWYGLTAFPFT